MSTRSLGEKLLIKPNMAAAIINEPEHFTGLLGKLPPGVTVSTELAAEYDLIVVFVKSKRELDEQVVSFRKAVKQDSIIWISYPKGAKEKSDLNRDIIREYLERKALKAASLISIDSLWSAFGLR